MQTGATEETPGVPEKVAERECNSEGQHAGTEAVADGNRDEVTRVAEGHPGVTDKGEVVTETVEAECNTQATEVEDGGRELWAIVGGSGVGATSVESSGEMAEGGDEFELGEREVTDDAGFLAAVESDGKVKLKTDAEDCGSDGGDDFFDGSSHHGGWEDSDDEGSIILLFRPCVSLF